MAGIGNRNDGDDLLIEALLDTLGQNERSPKSTDSLHIPERGAHSQKKFANASSLSQTGPHDSYGDSGLSDVFYSESASEDEHRCAIPPQRRDNQRETLRRSTGYLGGCSEQAEHH